MDFASLRADFPFLTKDPKRQSLVYFDNACMTLRPQSVIDTLTAYYTHFSACAGRSNHRQAQLVASEVAKARGLVQQFLHAKYESEIIFTRNTTEGINLVAHSLGLKSGDCVLTSDKEHNSNLIPWLKLETSLGIRHEVFFSNPDHTFNEQYFQTALEKFKPKLVSIVHTSNLDGVTFPIASIIKVAHQAGALVMVDAAQSAPHMPLDVQKLDVDFLAFSGHKLCGPSGMGVLYGKRDLLNRLSGFMVGGDTVESSTYESFKFLPVPEKFEAGLQDYAGIMGLGAAISYLTKIGLTKIHEHEIKLNQQLTDGLTDIPRLQLLGPMDPNKRGGIFSFYVDGVDPHQISLLLDKSYGILVRSGQHCVHSWFHAHDLKGSVRASLYFYNTPAEVDYFITSLKQILEII